MRRSQAAKQAELSVNSQLSCEVGLDTVQEESFVSSEKGSNSNQVSMSSSFTENNAGGNNSLISLDKNNKENTPVRIRQRMQTNG